ncbi:hypothetical protein BZG36_03394 [Bifiguratus adelaidae]|uniref:Sof1-like protein domain-containing protein n=1 Tax=Bifiguratus adelaidae TaxID=1938954 RepID=A0A261Y0E6_9FUNG|nr:hypothetical protein BZG36_03394 [Bifiguratus adelaidae]
MKVKALSRSTADYTRERAQDIHKVQRNLDPDLHPFEKPREYVRALNAVKLERLYAKPFVGALSGHIDGVYSMAKHPWELNKLISGSGDGEIRIWSLSEQETTWSTQGHKSIVRGVCPSPFNNTLLSCSVDKTVKLWRPSESTEPISTFVGKNAFSQISHHRKDPLFATSGATVDIWDENRSEPIHTFSWDVDTINTVRFNQTETSVLASCGTDRAIILYDLRTMQPLAKLLMQLKANAIAWNPMEAFNFVVGSEDHNCYMFDMRKMTSATNVLKGHQGAVLDVDFSPTGEEIVTGSYDKTLRIFKTREGHSRDLYHTKRMQRVFCAQYSMDSKYVLSGSDEGSIRIWKAKASDKMGVKDFRERASLDYNEKLKERYGDLPELKRIARHRHVPKAIKTASATKSIMLESRKVKEENLRKHSKPGAVPYKAERKKAIVAVKK